MGQPLKALLRLTPGVSSRSGLRIEGIDMEDWTTMLTIRDADSDAAVGRWVRLCKGAYKADVGYVLKQENWGGVTVLLVPRLPPASEASHKRKRSSSSFPPALFNPDDHIGATRLDNGSYLYKGSKYEHGLLLQQYDCHSFSSTGIDLPQALFAQFYTSNHPQLRNAIYPRPGHWVFTEGEPIRVSSTGKQGIFKSGADYHAEVEYIKGEGIGSVAWLDLRKDVAIGDFVEVTSGIWHGTQGWVDHLDGDVVSVVKKSTTDRPDNVEVCYNFLTAYSVDSQ
jgi:hypothetical protein